MSKIKLQTFDHLFKLQELSKDAANNEQLGAYYRWRMNKLCCQFDQELSINRKNSNKNKLNNLSSLCPICLSWMTHFKIIPKKSEKKKIKLKKGSNYEYNIIKTNCNYCGSKFKFKGLMKEKSCSIKNKKVAKIDSGKRSKQKYQKNEKKMENLNKTPQSDNKRPQKEMLEKLLSSSKKKRNLDKITNLSQFLNSCFK